MTERDEAKPLARRRARRWLKWGAVALATVALAIGGYLYYEHGIRYPSTDDAYIAANVIKVGAQVSGRILGIAVADQQTVREGEALLSLDPREFRYRLRQAKAELALAKQSVAADQAAVEAAQAAVDDRTTALDNARREYLRAERLAKRQVVSTADLDDARAALHQAESALNLAQANLAEAKIKRGAEGDENDRVRAAQAQLDQARLDLAHSVVEAPCGGSLSGVKARPGDLVQAGEPLFALVCSERFWVYANYKETDIGRIRPGQVATVSVDMYPDHAFHAVVESIDPASGAAFSLLPPENASGNWVKVTQRVPVRLLIIDDSPAYPLRVQTSATVTADTGAGEEPVGLPRGRTLTDAEALRSASQAGLAVQAR